MKITLTNAGKRFNRDWIFRHIHYEFVNSHSYAITGPNGSGKSTLLQVIAGAMGLNEGSIEYLLADQYLPQPGKGFPERNPVKVNQEAGPVQRPGVSAGVQEAAGTAHYARPANTESIHRYLSLATPYLELIEEMTLREFLAFHAGFKPFLSSVSPEEIMESVQLSAAADKQIRYFSSGMKQRTKLAQAIFSDTPLLLLDEPCTNLDEDGIQLYQQLIGTYAKEKLVIVSSNDKAEYRFCDEILDVRQYK